MELYEAVADACIRLRAAEEEYERGLEAGSAVLRITGREYASAVHNYSNAVMAWLKWFDIYGDSGEAERSFRREAERHSLLCFHR
jgi:hypothetical protein